MYRLRKDDHHGARRRKPVSHLPANFGSALIPFDYAVTFAHVEALLVC